MTVLYSSNFDADTVGTLPSGWANVVGSFLVNTQGAVSGSNALRSTNASDGNMAIYNGATAADGTVALSVRFLSGNIFPGTIFRADAGFANGYVFTVEPARSVINLYKRVGGSFAAIANNIPTGSALSGASVGDIIDTEARFVGSTLEFRIWRRANGRPGTATVTQTDTTFLGAGRGGVYQGSDNSAQPNGFDDFIVSDAASTTPTPSPTTIARDNSALRYSPYTWGDNGSSRNANTTGSYLEFGFTGTSLGVNIAALSGLSAYPVLRAYIDSVPAVDVQLTSGQTAVSFATGLTSGSHTARIVIAKINEEDGWWSLANAIKLTGVVIDNGASVSAITPRSKRLIIFGDSIIQGVRVLGASPAYPNGMDGTRSIAPLIAKALDAELGQVGYGSQGFTQGGNGNVPGFNTAYSNYSSGASRLSGGVLSPAPDYVVCMHGTNGSTSQADAATAITNLRTIAPNAITLMIVPPGGFARAAITAAVAAAVQGGDRAVKLVDLGAAYQTGLTAFGAANERSSDGVHPYAWTNAELAAEISAQIQQAIEPRRFTVVTA